MSLPPPRLLPSSFPCSIKRSFSFLALPHYTPLLKVAICTQNIAVLDWTCQCICWLVLVIILVYYFLLKLFPFIGGWDDTDVISTFFRSCLFVPPPLALNRQWAGSCLLWPSISAVEFASLDINTRTCEIAVQEHFDPRNKYDFWSIVLSHSQLQYCMAINLAFWRQCVL